MSDLFLDAPSATNLLARYLPGASIEFSDGGLILKLSDGVTIALDKLSLEGRVLAQPLEIRVGKVALEPRGLHLDFTIG